MEQFSLEKYLENPSRKVITKDGRVVKILDTEFESGNGNKSVLAKCIYNNKAAVYVYTTDGKANNIGETENDLFFADEENTELTEFEKAIYIDICTIVTSCDGRVYGDKELKLIVKEIAKELLDLARKEILKDLPKWKKSDRNWITNICDLATIVRCDGGDHEDYDSVVVSNRVDKDDYYIELGELLKLPKEE